MSRTIPLSDGMIGAIAEMAIHKLLRREMEAGRLIVFSNVGEVRETVALMRSESGNVGMVVARWREDE